LIEVTVRFPARSGKRGYVSVLVCCLLAACSSDPRSVQPKFSSAPEVAFNPNGRSPLAALVSFTANKPVKARYEIVDNELAWEYTSSKFRSEHQQALIGIPAGASHALSITLIDQDDRRTTLDQPLVVSLPDAWAAIDGFPQINGQSSGLLSDITLLSLFRFGDAETTEGPWLTARDENYSLLIALDSSLQVRWSLEVDYLVEVIEQTTPTTLTLVSARGRETIDFLGDRVRRVRGERQGPPGIGDATVTTLTADNLHNGGATLPNGHELLLSTELRILRGYPTPNNEPFISTPAEAWKKLPAIVDYPAVPDESAVVGDVVIEVTPEGEIVGRWNLFDLLDYRRPSYYGSLSTWASIYPPNNKFGSATSWTQANGLVYDSSTDTIVASLRHQAAIVGIDRQSGELKWILGDPSGWQKPWSQKLLTRVKDDHGQLFDWPYFPSSIALMEDGELLLIDDGGYQAVPPDDPRNPSAGLSRVMTLRIDDSAMRVEQTFGFEMAQQAELEDHEYLTARDLNAVTGIPGTTDILIAQGYSGKLLRVNADGTGDETVAELSPRSDSNFNWGIADVLTITTMLPPSGNRNASKDLAISATETVTDKLETASMDTRPPMPNITIPDLSIDGRWTLKVGDDPYDGEQDVTLTQNGRLIEGDIDDYPIVAWVQGNTFSMTVRREGSLGQVRLRYRGVINADGSRIEGNVAIDNRGSYLGSHTWAANKL